MTEDNNIYLGDGVYASFDGYQIWLAVNHHENKQVALEPKVMEALLEYANRVLGWGGYD
jgi:acyl-CoA thioesterase FadM